MGEWTLQVNLAGVTPVAPIVDLPTGPYKVKIVDSDLKANNEQGKAPNVFFDTVIDEGEYAGAMQNLIIGTDLTKDFLRRKWRTACQSISAPLNILDQASGFSLGAANFRGKTAYIFVKAAAAGEVGEGGAKQYADRDFITPEMYQRMKASLGVRTQAPAQIPGMPAATGAPAAVGGAFVPTTPQPPNGAAVAAALNF